MATTIDNRDLTEVNKYLEARVEALVARIQELEAENSRLWESIHEGDFPADLVFK